MVHVGPCSTDRTTPAVLAQAPTDRWTASHRCPTAAQSESTHVPRRPVWSASSRTVSEGAGRGQGLDHVLLPQGPVLLQHQADGLGAAEGARRGQRPALAQRHSQPVMCGKVPDEPLRPHELRSTRPPEARRHGVQGVKQCGLLFESRRRRPGGGATTGCVGAVGRDEVDCANDRQSMGGRGDLPAGRNAGQLIQEHPPGRRHRMRGHLSRRRRPSLRGRRVAHSSRQRAGAGARQATVT